MFMRRRRPRPPSAGRSAAFALPARWRRPWGRCWPTRAAGLCTSPSTRRPSPPGPGARAL